MKEERKDEESLCERIFFFDYLIVFRGATKTLIMDIERQAPCHNPYATLRCVIKILTTFS